MKWKNFSVLMLLVCVCMCFSACNIFYTQSNKTIKASGKVGFENSALSGVNIKTKTQVLCKTDENGNYNFSIKFESVLLTSCFASASNYLSVDCDSCGAFIVQYNKKLEALILNKFSRLNIVTLRFFTYSEKYLDFLNTL